VPVEVRMPQLALSMTEGTVGKWLKTEGETVQAGEPLVEVLTEKVATEIAAPARSVASTSRACRPGACREATGKPRRRRACSVCRYRTRTAGPGVGGGAGVHAGNAPPFQ